MRNIDGLQPQEAFDELLKYMYLKESMDDGFHQFPSPSLFSSPTASSSSNKKTADDLRSQLFDFLAHTNSWTSEIWRDRTFHLSDAALLSVHEIFDRIDFRTIDFDTRSAALNEFISTELRKGLGIFPTPDAVARMMVEVASPRDYSHVLDPACGTGTFLIETLRYWQKKSTSREFHVWGIDKSPRMLLLSELNLGHNDKVRFWRELADTLHDSPLDIFNDVYEGFDYIFTNPPFGVVIDNDKHDATNFLTFKSQKNQIVKRQQSEVLFVEQCLKCLRPGGLLAIVLPRSVVTNSSLDLARKALDELGYVESVVTLPPETFAASGVQTNTVVLFMRRYRSSLEKQEKTSIVSISVDNVGFDSTGRPRKGSQLGLTSEMIRKARRGDGDRLNTRVLPEVEKGLSVSNLPSLLSGRVFVSYRSDGILLRDLVDICTNGKTPGREHYSTDGLFLVKVGNLTGRGINWEARERNFINGSKKGDRKKRPHLMLRSGDILLTSSAHSPKYIAKKVDLVGSVPQWVGGEASFVGEVMLLRVKEDMDPAVLAAYFRLPLVRQYIQGIIRGQTAHLHPKDVLQVQVPRSILQPTDSLRKLADNIRQEVRLADQINKLAHEQIKLTKSIEEILDDNY